jgi:hypothetical protein
LWALVCLFGGADLEAKEPSVATMLTSFENSFDKYEALSTPLYQTATFKQVIEITNECCPFFVTKMGNQKLRTLPVRFDFFDKYVVRFHFHLLMVSPTRLHYQL